MSVVRISRGSFPTTALHLVRERLDESQRTLIPAIRRMDGLISYHVGVDADSSTMVNVSVWTSLDAAQQMSTLPEMQALAGEFIGLGVVFERPIVNYDSLWQIDGA